MSTNPAKLTTALPVTGLVLTGGGARAAYQVGVLHAIADIRNSVGAQAQANPFPIITGTSAGAINAAAMACGVDDFDSSIRRIVNVWKNFKSEQVYRVDSFSLLHSNSNWMRALSVGWQLMNWQRRKQRSLLDNSPLHDLLHDLVPLERLPELIRQGHLKALAISASSYRSGDHITFFEGEQQLKPWMRQQRRSLRDRITHGHLLASAAIPFVFPASPLQIEGRTEYFGDGSMRHSAPIGAAIHLGANRAVVVGAGRMNAPQDEAPGPIETNYPSLAQIAGHALANIFLDALVADVEMVRRINQTLSLVPPEIQSASILRPVELLVITPSQHLDAIAARHVSALPATVRSILGIGNNSKTRDARGAALASYLLFESSYTSELMALGYADVKKLQGQVCTFFGWTDARAEKEGAGAQPERTERRRDPLRLR